MGRWGAELILTPTPMRFPRYGYYNGITNTIYPRISVPYCVHAGIITHTVQYPHPSPKISGAPPLVSTQ